VPYGEVSEGPCVLRGEEGQFRQRCGAAMALSLGNQSYSIVMRLSVNDSSVKYTPQPSDRIRDRSRRWSHGESSQDEVITLLTRIFENKMEYELKQKTTGLRLVEKLTSSTVRLQTKNSL
jgi:hypothetical protein